MSLLARRSYYLNALGIPAWRLRQDSPYLVSSSEQAVVGRAPALAAEPADVVAPVNSLERANSPERIENPSHQTPPDVRSSQNQALARLSAQVAQCQACDLYRGRSQTVFAAGNPEAEWMVIGEAPGAEEDKQGQPFVGRAGKLLDKMLLALGLDRQGLQGKPVYIANIIKCRPSNNRDPRPEEIEQCIGYLHRQIALVQPKMILLVGRIAAQTLLQSQLPIGKLRGQVHRIGESPAPVIVTYHPAYLLRSPSEKQKAWADLRLARKTFDRDSV